MTPFSSGFRAMIRTLTTWAAASLIGMAAVHAAEVGAPTIAPDATLTITSGPTLFGFSNIQGKYRFDPTRNMLTEGGNRAVDLGVQTQFVFIDTSTSAYKNGSAAGETFSVSPSQPPAMQVQDPIFDRYLRRPEIPIVVALIPQSAVAHLPAGHVLVDDAYYEPERQAFFNLTKQLYQQFNGTGKTFVLKNWEGDWLMLEIQGNQPRRCNNPLDGSGIPVPDSDADIVCAKNFLRWLRARQRGVADARAQFGGASNVKVYYAVEVNRVQDAMRVNGSIRGYLRLTHLIPYIGPDLIAYSSWDSTNTGSNYSAVSANLNASIGMLMSQSQQLQLTSPGGRFAGQFAEFPVQPDDPLGFGSKRILLTEFGVPEREAPVAEVDFRIHALVDRARALNVAGAYFWQLYDNECGVGAGGQPVNCRGFWLYDTTGAASTALAKMRQYAGWLTPPPPAAPTNLRVVPTQPVFGGSTSLAWNASPTATRYFVVVTPPAGNSYNVETPNTWYTLAASSPVGSYQWRVAAARSEGTSPYTQGPAFTIVASGGTRNAAFVSQSVPTSLARNQTASVSVTVRNTGTAVWTRAASYRLGSQNPQDNLTWSIGRVDLASGDSIAGQQTKTFIFTIRAPATAGTYNFQWRMLQEGVEWFGAFTPNVTIQVQ